MKMPKKTKRNILLGIIFLLLLLLVILPKKSTVPAEPEIVKIPVKLADSTFWDEARITKPQGQGPFPLIVMTHGTPRLVKARSQTTASTYFKKQSAYFASKGYAVIFVVRRGFGSSTAPYAENPLLANGTRNYTQAGLEAAKDLKAAVEYMRGKPYIDAKRIILLGQSTGGHSVIAAGSLNIDGVIGVINFAGGRGSYAPDLIRNEDNLLASMGQYGKTSRIPTLWLYSSNDHFFRPAVAQAMYKAYTENGGQATFVTLPAYSNDGHKSFVGNPKGWEPYVEQFLETLQHK